MGDESGGFQTVGHSVDRISQVYRCGCGAETYALISFDGDAANLETKAVKCRSCRRTLALVPADQIWTGATPQQCETLAGLSPDAA
jgi:hypothetical protein